MPGRYGGRRSGGQPAHSPHADLEKGVGRRTGDRPRADGAPPGIDARVASRRTGGFVGARSSHTGVPDANLGPSGPERPGHRHAYVAAVDVAGAPHHPVERASVSISNGADAASRVLVATAGRRCAVLGGVLHSLCSPPPGATESAAASRTVNSVRTLARDHGRYGGAHAARYGSWAPLYLLVSL
jgi:hypothetical protein